MDNVDIKLQLDKRNKLKGSIMQHGYSYGEGRGERESQREGTRESKREGGRERERSCCENQLFLYSPGY